MATVWTSPCLLHGLHDGVLKIALGISEKKPGKMPSNHGQTMGKHRKISENVRKPWENHGKTMGKPMEKPRKCEKTIIKYGKTMEKPWENPWKNHGKTHGSLLMKINNEPRSLLATWLTGNAYQSSKSSPCMVSPQHINVAISTVYKIAL